MVTVHVSREILAVGISISIIVAFLALVISGACKTRKAAQQEAARGRRRAPPTAMEAEEVEMGRPLLCRYLKADGWPNATCGVCLAELADGDALRVLPPCMHYFHAACVGEWLRAHDTCPFCRGPIAAARPA